MLWALLLLLVLAVWNLRAYTPVGNLQTALKQLHFLRDKLQNGSAEAAQQIFPEGYLFSWVLYGLGNTQLAAQIPNHPKCTWLLKNAQTAIAKLESYLISAP